MQYWWLFLLAIPALILGGLYIAFRKTVNDLTRGALFGKSLKKFFSDQSVRLSETPCSVNAMTRIYLPQIAEDFPEFSWNEFRQKAENMLKSALLAISGQDISLLSGAGKDLKKQVELLIADDITGGICHRYDNIGIHRTEIASYQKKAGTCVVVLQSALGCLDFTESLEDGRVLSGSDQFKKQTRYNIELTYIQNEGLIPGGNVTGAGLKCPNCGAPIPDLGQKTCAYCHMAVAELNLRVWAFTGFREV